MAFDPDSSVFSDFDFGPTAGCCTAAGGGLTAAFGAEETGFGAAGAADGGRLQPAMMATQPARTNNRIASGQARREKLLMTSSLPEELLPF
jgi:hypothetical protein